MSGTTATISATFAGTGRLIKADSVYGNVAAWAKSSSRNELEQSEIFKLIHRQIQNATVASEVSLSVFRGRTPPFENPIPLAMEMGPPPCPNSQGRYSIADHGVLYTSSSVDGAYREVLSGKEDIWIQEFKLPLKSLRIADFRHITSELDHILNCALWNAELSGTKGYPSLIYSQSFASWVSEIFDGFALPGVKGNSSDNYFNIVIFHPENNWQNWLGKRAPFKYDP